MGEPWGLDNPFTRIVDVRAKAAQHGLADPLKPNHAQAAGLNHFYPKGGPAWEQNSLLGNNADNFIDEMPGRFSGEMRKVVQDHLSRGVQIPYSYTFAKTHGIFTASNGDKYIIEITSGGIRAWQLNIAVPTDSDYLLDSLTYVPRPTADPADGTVIDIAVAGLSTVYGYSPMFSECGWAFDHTNGHTASAVVFQDRTDAPENVGPSYGYSRLYTITITEALNKPASASVALIEEDWLYGDRITQFKYPDYTNESLLSYDWFRNRGVAPVTGDRTAPIHCWYEGSTLRVCRYYIADGTTANYNTSSITFPTSGSGDDPDTSYWGNYSTTTGIRKCFESPSYGVYDGSTITGAPSRWYRRETNVGINISTSQGLIADVWAIQTRTGVDDSDQVNTDVLVIPFNEREGVFHLREIDITTDDTGETFSSAKIYKKQGISRYHDPNGGEPLGYSTSGPGNTVFCFCPTDCNLFHLGGEDGNVTGYLATGGTGIWLGREVNYQSVPIYYYRNNASIAQNCGTGGYYPEFQQDYTTVAENAVKNIGIDQGDVNKYTLHSVYEHPPWSQNGMPAYRFTYHRTDGSSPYDGYYVSINPIYQTHEHSWKPYVLRAPNAWERTNPASSTSNSVDSAGAYLNGATYALPTITQDDIDSWSRYIDDPVNDGVQYLIAAVDNSGNVTPLYTDTMVPDESTLALAWEGPATYPVDEVEELYPSWVGNP